MIYVEKTEKKVDDVVLIMQEKISEYKFGILHIHNVKETLTSKGIDFKEECRILDVCNPNIAKDVLSNDMSLSSMMPCKISVYEKEGETFIAMNSMISMIKDIKPELIGVAKEVEDTLLKFINEVK